MQNHEYINSTNTLEDEIDIRKLFQIIWNGKMIIFSITTIFSLIAVSISLYLPNIYQSKALLSPTGQQSSGMDSMAGIGGLANLAGISFSPQSNPNSTRALKKLRTLSFFEDNILPNIFLPDLAAVDSWDSQNNKVLYSSNYDLSSNTFIDLPSTQKSYKSFMKKIDVDVDIEGFVTISVKHHSPYVAKAWTELIVNQLNQFFRTQDKLEAQASIDFLNAQTAQTSYTEIKEIIAQLLQQNIQKLTLIEANEFYVFSYLDPPIVEEEKIEPTRSSISILGAVIGFMLSIFIVLVSNFFRHKK